MCCFFSVCRATLFAFFMIAALALGIPAQADPIYVDNSATGAGTGASWTDAFVDLQSALDAAPAAGDEIWIAVGTYYPTMEIGGSGERFRAFALKNGVAVFGGFAGDESSLDQRDWQTHAVILSGDIGVVGDISDNSYHVFYHEENSYLDETAVLDGCTITGGNGDLAGGDNRRGGGMYNEDSSPTVANCTFTDNRSVGGSYSYGGGLFNRDSSPWVLGCTFINNTAGTAGGGLYNMSASSPVISDCVFVQNVAGLESSGLGNGGAVYNSNSSTPVFKRCTFENNQSNYNGGAVYNDGDLANITLASCRFTDNTTGLYGGAIYNNQTNPEITQCLFNRNSSTAGNAHGGVIYNFVSDPRFTSCVFYDNESGCVGNGIYNYQFSSPVFTNCILSGSDVIYDSSNCQSTVTYSNIQQSGFEDPSLHNIAADPLLLDPGNGDFHLAAGSPCIDAGDNDLLPADVADLDGDGDTVESLPLDFFGNIRCQDDPAVVDTGHGTAPFIDMGLHEFGTGGASSVPVIRNLNISNYPNPFNPATTIVFDLPRAMVANLEIYDAAGRLVAVLLNEDLARQGRNEILWQGRTGSGRVAPTGIYFYRLQTGGQVVTRRMTLLK